MAMKAANRSALPRIVRGALPVCPVCLEAFIAQRDSWFFYCVTGNSRARFFISGINPR
jgi:hypothetical protein